MSRSLVHQPASARLTRLLHPTHSNPHLHSLRHSSTTSSTPLIKVTNIPAPHLGSIRILSLNRPTARNAISRQLLSELHQHVQTLHDEVQRPTSAAPTDSTGPIRAMILASEVDGVFCAGADLKERATFTPPQTLTFLTSLRQTLTLLSTLPIPTIACVPSLALGGGLELALTTTFRVFSSLSAVGLPETRLGIIPGAGGTYRLPALIGTNRARDLILTGRRVGGAEAYFLGLCDRLVEVTAEEKGEEEDGGKGVARAKVLKEGVRLAAEICEGGPVAVGAALRAVSAVGKGGEEREGREYETVVGTEDRDEALRAFAEKRRPVFRGR